jgi:hypothetical protein
MADKALEADVQPEAPSPYTSKSRAKRAFFWM